ncbi:MAG: CPBP family intramembrane metalloprotease [Ignavibacteriae bacterium]|nr:CPBP family intramembrane metalloprotease [Ignavibacteriota bacterium]
MEAQTLPIIEQTAQSEFNGSWEQKGRSPNSAALLGLLGIGALYFNASSILFFIVSIVVLGGGELPNLEGTFFERFSDLITFFAEPVRAVTLVSQYLFMLLPALWLVKRWHSSEIRIYVRLRGGSIWEIFLAVAGTLAVIPVSNYIAEFLVRQLGIPDEVLELGSEVFTAHSPFEFAWLVVVVCITPAICEEIFFRGFAQRTFERTMGWKSILLTGVFFGLFHFQPLGLITLSMLGILFGYFFYRSKSLFPAMAAHFTNNLVAIWSLYQTPEMQEEGISATADQIPLWLVGASLPVAAGILYAYHLLTRKKAVDTTQS